MGAPEWILAALVAVGALPLLTGCYQFMLAVPTACAVAAARHHPPGLHGSP
jgi:hypothetical protein